MIQACPMFRNDFNVKTQVILVFWRKHTEGFWFNCFLLPSLRPQTPTHPLTSHIRSIHKLPSTNVNNFWDEKLSVDKHFNKLPLLYTFPYVGIFTITFLITPPLHHSTTPFYQCPTILVCRRYPYVPSVETKRQNYQGRKEQNYTGAFFNTLHTD